MLGGWVLCPPHHPQKISVKKSWNQKSGKRLYNFNWFWGSINQSLISENPLTLEMVKRIQRIINPDCLYHWDITLPPPLIQRILIYSLTFIIGGSGRLGQRKEKYIVAIVLDQIQYCQITKTSLGSTNNISTCLMTWPFDTRTFRMTKY